MCYIYDQNEKAVCPNRKIPDMVFPADVSDKLLSKIRKETALIRMIGWEMATIFVCTLTTVWFLAKCIVIPVCCGMTWIMVLAIPFTILDNGPIAMAFFVMSLFFYSSFFPYWIIVIRHKIKKR